MMIHSNNDFKITQKKNNTRTTKSSETMETEITTESLNIAVNKSDARSHKSNQLYHLIIQLSHSI